MLSAGTLDELIAAVEGLGLLQAPQRVHAPETNRIVGLEGNVEIAGHEVKVRVMLEGAFPLRLPRFYLCPWDALGFIPHVDRRGEVCYAEPEGLVMDRHRLLQVIVEAFNRMVAVLTAGVTGTNQADFVDEFEVYWAQSSDFIVASSMLEPTARVRRVMVAIEHGEQSERLYVAADEMDISSYYNGANVSGKMTLLNAIFLPLEPGSIVVPPRADGPFWTAADARAALLSNLSDENRKLLRGLLKKRTRQREYVIVSLPRTSGGATLFGIRFDEVGQRHPLLDGGGANRVVPLVLQRRDHGYLVQRGGGDIHLSKRKVLVVGCGAVGGHLAIELARAGVLDLTLVDPDHLTPENSFRHALGRRYWGQHKATALKAEIEAELPYVRVTAVADTIQNFLGVGSGSLDSYDLVVLATGNPIVELEINAQLHAQASGPPAVFAWLEPLGIGGHALLVKNAPDGGCFECLFTSNDEVGEFAENRAAFAAPGQSFGRALSGCGSLFTPYGSVDAVRTATAAVRLVIDALTKVERRNALVSWKGASSAFEAAGFCLSQRYSSSEDELERQRHAFASSSCRVCHRQQPAGVIG